MKKISQQLQNQKNWLSSKSQVLQTPKNQKKLAKSLDFVMNKTPKTDFITFEVKKAFTKALIFYYSDSKRHIHIETDVSNYAISKIPSQMTLDKQSSDHIIYKNLKFSKSKSGQWYLVVLFSRKMILA